MKKYLNKLLAFLLVIAMTATLLPESVCAAYRFDPSECPAARFHSNPESTDPENYHWNMTDVSNATCTADGWYELTCVYCGYKARVTGDRAYGHSWTGWVDVTTATCTEKGQRKRSCLNCGLQEDDYTAALGHSWGDWKTTKEAGCETEGQKTHTCLRCEETEKQSIAALGHSWGDWKTEKEPDCENEGQKVRTCSRCQETEKQSIPANGHTPGEWQLGEDGTCQKVCSVCQKVLETTEIIEEVTEEKEATSNGNGTHDFKLYEITQKYYTNENGEKVAIGDPEREMVQEDTEACAISNSELACSDCGYQSNLMAWISMYGGFDLTNIALMWKRPSYNLPWVENLTYSHPYFYWDAVEGAVRYAVTIKEWEDGSAINSTEITSDNIWVDLSEYVTTGKEYAIFVVALDKEDTMVSEETDMLIYIEEEEGPQKISQVEVKGRTVYWTPINNPGNYGYRVILRKGYCGDETVWTYETYLTEYTIPKSMLKEGCYYCVSVLYYDGNGVEPDSEWTTSASFLYNPTLYMVVNSANVRSGPGKNFGRLGGLSIGTVIEGIGVEKGYVRFDFNGEYGWVSLDNLRISSTEIYEITMKVECQKDDRSYYDVVEVRMTDGFGRVDMSQPSDAYYSGSVFAGWNKEGASEAASVLPEDTEFTADTILEGFWTDDESKVMLQYDAQIQDFDSTTSFYVTKGQTIGESATMPLLTSWNGVRLDWYTGPEGSGEKVTDSYLIPEDYDKAYMTLYGMPAEETWYTLVAPAVLYEDMRINSEKLEKLNPGDEVRLIDAATRSLTENGKAYGTSTQWFLVETKKGNIGYICNLDGQLQINPVVTFDAGRGFTPVLYMKTQSTAIDWGLQDSYTGGKLDRLPEAKRDGYYFLGWYTAAEGDDLEPVNLQKVYVENTVLYARYAQIPDKVAKTGLVYKPYGSSDSAVIRKNPSSDSKILSEGKNICGSIIQILGEEDDYYYGYVDGIKGYVQKKYVTFRYYEAEVSCLGSGKIYQNPECKGAGTGFRIHDENVKVYVVGEYAISYQICWNNSEIKSYSPDPKHPSGGFVQKDDLVNKHNITVTFDAGTGIVLENGQTKYTLTMDDKHPHSGIGTLPEAENEYGTFLGWFTDPYLGTRIRSITPFYSDTTVYAHYTRHAKVYFTFGDVMPLKKTNSEDSKTIGYLSCGSIVTVHGYYGDYAKVGWNGKIGFLHTKFLKDYGVIMVSVHDVYGGDYYDIDIRSGATRKTKSYGYVEPSTCYLTLGLYGDYWKVAYNDGFAYIHKDMLIKQ